MHAIIVSRINYTDCPAQIYELDETMSVKRKELCRLRKSHTRLNAKVHAATKTIEKAKSLRSNKLPSMSERVFVSSAKRRADPEAFLAHVESECKRMRLRLGLAKPETTTAVTPPPASLKFPLPPWVDKIKKCNKIKGISR